MAAGWIEFAVIAVGGGGGAGLITSLAPLVRSVMNGSSNRAVATKTQVEASMLMVNELQDEVRDTRTELREARAGLSEARDTIGKLDDEVNTVRGKMAQIATQMSHVIGWIHEPDMSMERLRIRVPRIPSENGVEK